MKKVYFEPPSRLQLLDKLKHLVRFSDFLLLVSGDKGAGKSTLVTQLLPGEADTTLHCCALSLHQKINEQQLLEQLMLQLPSHEQGGAGFADQLKVFHLQLKALHSVGKKCLIIIDNAEHLDPSAESLLLNLHALQSSSDTGAQLLLLSSPLYVGRLLNNADVKHMEGRVHQLELEGMADDEAEEFLQLCHPVAASLPEKKRQEIVRASEGMPGRMEALLAGKAAPVSASTAPATAFPLPMLHMSIIGVLLMAIVAASLWQFLPEEAVESTVEQSSERVSLPLNVAVSQQEGDGQATDKVTEITVKPESDQLAEKIRLAEEAKKELAQRLKAQEAKLQEAARFSAEPQAAPVIVSASADVESEPVVSEKKDETKVVEQPKAVLVDELKAVVAKTENKIQVKKPTAEVVVVEKSESAPTATVKKIKQPEPTVEVKKSKLSSSGESALLAWSPKGYTLQMLGARSEESALDFIKSQKQPEKFHHFSTLYKGGPWHVVVYGQFANRDVANAAIRKLPSSLQKIKPWARSIQGVQVDIRKKKTQ